MSDLLSKIEFVAGNMSHFGLKNIYTSEKEITQDNILKHIQSFYNEFEKNRKQILQLKDIMVGKQAILSRAQYKETPNEQVNINIIFPIVNTIAGLYLGEKIDYIYNDEDKQKTKDTIELVKHLRYNGDILLDKNSLVEMLVCGYALQYSGSKDDKKSPVLLANIESENGFVVRYTGVGKPVVLTCIVGEEVENNTTIANGEKSQAKTVLACFTDTEKITLIQDSMSSSENNGWKIDKDEEKTLLHNMPRNPIQEIQLNPYLYSLVAQLEAAQNAFNVSVSDSINSIIQQIRALLVILGAEITKEDAENAQKTGVLNATSANGQQITASFLTKPLDEGIINLRTFLFDIIGFIAGLPKTGGTSGNAGAAYAASGLLQANQNAYFNELEFQKPKQALIDNVITALRDNKIIKSNLSSFDIEIRFDRNKLTDIQSSTTALATLLGINGMPAKDALKVVGLFSDIDSVSKKIEEAVKKSVINGLTNQSNNANVGGNANATAEV